MTKDGVKEHFKNQWIKWVSGVFVSFLIPALLLLANDQIKNRTNAYLSSTEGRGMIASIIDEDYKNAIGSSYQAHFVLGKKRNTFERSIPIYVMDESHVYLYLEMIHSGPDSSVNVDLSVDGHRIDFDMSKSSELTKIIDLTSYIAEAKKAGIYDFDNIVTVNFRADPTQKTGNIVSVKALINVLGMPVMGR